jgi:type VI secretion system protein ImpE
MNAKECFEAGNLAGAIEIQNEKVRSAPSDAEARTFLFELLCFAGNWERARKQLDAIAQQDTEADMAAQVYRNLLTAEERRRRFFEDGLLPEFLLDPPGYMPLQFQAINRLRENRPDEAQGLLTRLVEDQAPLSGTLNGTPFDELRDCDDVIAPCFELLMIDQYILIPWEQVRELEVSRPERPRDLIWAPCRLLLSDSSQKRGYVPTLYYRSWENEDDRIKLGRATDWYGEEGGPVRGLGQRLLLAGDRDVAILEVRELLINPPADRGG